MGEYKYESMGVWEYGNSLPYFHTSLLSSRFPWNFLCPNQHPDISGQHKQIITKPVQIFNNKRLGKRFLLIEFDSQALSTAANRATNMGSGNCNMPAWENKRFHFREPPIHHIDFIFQQDDIRFPEVRDLHGNFFVRVAGQGRSNGEQTVLDFTKHLTAMHIRQLIPQQTNMGIEFIHRSISLNPDMTFRNLGPPDQAGFPAIS